MFRMVIISDRTSEISSSDRASFPAGLLGQRLGQFFSQTITAMADLLKLDYFSLNPCDRPIQQRKEQGDRILFSYGGDRICKCSTTAREV
jgi:hypothetical protein